MTGPRQSGKTTLLKDIFPDFNYINFENLDTREFALQKHLVF
ncbi:AAA family ATPase [Aquiflexum lacus]|nr:AAA family ATPase [Aquiflexum lacus]